MLNISPVKPPDLALSDETRAKLMAGRLQTRRAQKEWRWQAAAAVCLAVGLGFFCGSMIGVW